MKASTIALVCTCLLVQTHTASAQMPERGHLFAADQLTDRSERFLCGEIIREKTMRYLGDELPYRTSVILDEFVDEDQLTRITATVWVDRDSQKSIVIGKSGALMKKSCRPFPSMSPARSTWRRRISSSFSTKWFSARNAARALAHLCYW